MTNSLRKRLLVIVFLLSASAALLALQQSGSYWVPLWNGTRYIWPRLGPSFVVQSGQIDVAVSVPSRTYGARITPNAEGKYMLPSTARNVVVYINGLRATESVDYQLSGSELVPLWAWDASTVIIADYDCACP